MKLKTILQEAQKDRAALAFLSQLVKKGPFANRVFLAGGAPRDMQLGADPKDLDVLVKGDSNAGIDFATWATKEIGNYKEGSNPVIYPRFFTAKFTLKGVTHDGIDLSDVDVEAVAPRKEKYTPGSRKPEVSAGELGDDVNRRDFTVNSLLHDLTTGEVLDLTGMGKDDIKKGIIRTPLDPDVIFTDDPLRILRAVRFAAKYNWKLPMFMLRSIRKNAASLKNISRERIHDEVNKMLLTNNAGKAMRLLKVLKLAPFVFPSIDRLSDTDLAGIDKRPKDLSIRLAALFYPLQNASAVAESELRNTKYDTDTIQLVKTILDNYRTLSDFSEDPTKVRELVASLGESKTMQVARFLAGDDDGPMKTIIRQQALFLRENPLPISGQDLIALGMKPGPKFSEILGAVKKIYLSDPKTDRQRYIQVIKSHL